MTQTTFDAHPRSSLIVALDFDSLSSAVKFATQLADLVGMFKIGNQLFTAAGPAAVKEISALGRGVFLDLKYHDIPNTDRKSTRLNSSHSQISYAVFCLKKKKMTSSILCSCPTTNITSHSTRHMRLLRRPLCAHLSLPTFYVSPHHVSYTPAVGHGALFS